MIKTYLYEHKHDNSTLIVQRDFSKSKERILHNENGKVKVRPWIASMYEIAHERKVWGKVYKITHIPKKDIEKYIFLESI